MLIEEEQGQQKNLKQLHEAFVCCYTWDSLVLLTFSLRIPKTPLGLESTLQAG